MCQRGQGINPEHVTLMPYYKSAIFSSINISAMQRILVGKKWGGNQATPEDYY